MGTEVRRGLDEWRRLMWKAAGYVPSPGQAAAHDDPSRFKLVAGGERGGKSFFSAMELLAKMRPRALYWIVGPDYMQTRAEFTYVLDALQAGPLLARISVPAQGGRTILTTFAAQVITRSADDVVKLASEAPDGVLLCEAAQCSYDVFLKLRGRVAQKRGWLVMSGTFEGSAGWYPEYFKRWQAANPDGGKSFSLPTWGNLVVYPLGENDPEILALRATYPPDLFLERFGAEPCAPATLVFKEFSFETHVSGDVKFDPEQPVELAIDPGYAGAYSVLAIQRRGHLVHVFDEVYRRGMVTEEIIALCQARPWWAKVTGGVIDVAAEGHPGMASHVEVWGNKAGVFLRSNRVNIEPGITRLRTFLKDPASGKPRVLFAASLPGGVDGLGVPRGILAEFGLYKYRELREGQPVREEPVDRDNHSLKALSYWLYDRFGPVERVQRTRLIRDRGMIR